MMKMTGKAFAKKLFGARYERLPRTLLMDVIVFWGLYIAGFHVRIETSVRLLMISAFTAGVMWQALSSKDNEEELKAMLMLPFRHREFVFSYVAVLGAYAVLTKTGLASGGFAGCFRMEDDKAEFWGIKNMMTGLKRGTVQLMSHQEEWNENAQNMIQVLNQLLGDTAIDIQHIGSTAIPFIHAKPIIDIVIGVQELDDILPYIELLKQHNFIYRGEDVAGQILFVMGNFKDDTRTHHIHVVKWRGEEWNNYINFRDYLNTHPEKAMLYDKCKKKLAAQFSHDRKSYTAGKQELIDCLLKEAGNWKSER